VRFRRYNWLDPGAGLLAAVCALVAVGPAADPLRLPGGILLALLLPGLEGGRALVPDQVGPIRRLVLSLALGLAVDVLGGVLLNFTPGGLSTATWASLLGTLAVVASATAWWRHRHRPRPDLPTITRPSRQMALVAIGATLMALAVAAGVVGGRAPAGPGYTQLWTLPSSSGGASAAEIGVHSVEPATDHFSVVVRASSRTLARYAFELAPGRTWTRRLDLPQSRARIEILLYRGSSSHTYRELWLELPG